jgi:hypothetical protein
MIRQDGKSQQVDPESTGQSLSLIFNHDFAMIVILATDGIVTQQVAATNHAIHHMHNRNFIRRKHFRYRSKLETRIIRATSKRIFKVKPCLQRDSQKTFFKG